MIRERIEKIILNSRFPPSHRVHLLHWLLELGQWLRRNPPGQVFSRKEDLYDFVNSLGGGAPVDYLEFGVFQGYSMKHWIRANQHPDSRFFGFDTFTGLPEKWSLFTTTMEAGTFDAGGALPDIQDSRVVFLKGLFQETLPGFVRDFQPRNRIVVHCDADLYTSELYVLTMLDQILVPGSIILFDDFATASHDFRAFSDYSSAYRRRFENLGSVQPSNRRIALKLVE